MSRGTCARGRAGQYGHKEQANVERCSEPVVRGSFFCDQHLALALERVRAVQPKRYVVLRRINGIPVGS